MMFSFGACGNESTKTEKEQPLKTEEVTDTVDHSNTGESTDGIDETAYKLPNNDLAIKMVNNTGRDIGLKATITYTTSDKTEGTAGYEQLYLPKGEAYIVLLDNNDSPIETYDIDYEIDKPSPSVKKYFEKTPCKVTKNEFGGLDFNLKDKTEGGYGEGVTIFYEDKKGKILGYEWYGIGGEGDYTMTFETPGYKYYKYEVIREKN